MQDAKTQGWMVLGGGAALAIGSFLPWASAFGQSVTGMDADDGVITLVLGLVLVALGYMMAMRETQRWMVIAALVVGLIAVVVALIDLFDVLGTEAVSVGIGLWIVVLGAIVAAAGAAMRMRAS